MSKRWLLLLPVLAACGSSNAREEQRVRDWQTMSSSRQLAGEKALNADVEFGAGMLQVRPAPAGTLYRGTLRYDRTRMKPAVSYADGNLHFAIEGHVRGRMRSGDMNRLDLQLGPDVPLTLDLKFGAGQADIDLGGLALQNVRIATGASRGDVRFSAPTKGTCEAVELQVGAAQMNVTGLGNASPRMLDVQGGAGEVNLDFSGAWRNDAVATFKLGMGGLRLDVPRGVGLRLRKNSVLASFEATNMVRQGDVYTSEGYQSAAHHIDVTIDAAFGSIRVNWVGDTATAGSF